MYLKESAHNSQLGRKNNRLTKTAGDTSYYLDYPEVLSLQFTVLLFLLHKQVRPVSRSLYSKASPHVIDTYQTFGTLFSFG
jgi:hypothetical protein